MQRAGEATKGKRRGRAAVHGLSQHTERRSKATRIHGYDSQYSVWVVRNLQCMSCVECRRFVQYARGSYSVHDFRTGHGRFITVVYRHSIVCKCIIYSVPKINGLLFSGARASRTTNISMLVQYNLQRPEGPIIHIRKCGSNITCI